MRAVVPILGSTLSRVSEVPSDKGLGVAMVQRLRARFTSRLTC